LNPSPESRRDPGHRRAILMAVGLALGAVVVVAVLLRREPAGQGPVRGGPGIPVPAAPGSDATPASTPPATVSAPVPANAPVRPPPPAEQGLPSTLSRRRESEKRLRGVFISKFTREADFGLREARLFGLTDPEGCERFALELTASAAKDPEAAAFGVEILGILTSQGRKSAEAALMAIATSPDHPSGAAAVQSLYEIDRRGDYQPVYLKRAAAGDEAAIRMLGTWPDPQAAPILRDLIQRNTGLDAPGSTIRMESEEALQRLDFIAAPDYDQRLAAVLAGEDKRFRLTWALKMADVRPPAGLVDLCRKRLDASEARALYDEQLLLQDQAQKMGAAQRQFLSAPYASYTHDRYFDDYLVLYAKAGGKLSDVERGRLNLFFDTDQPADRLGRWLSSREPATK
jgi:hypothetical protein